jgi:hypothetical protein
MYLQHVISKNFFFVGILSVTDEKSRIRSWIRIRIRRSMARIPGSRSVPKYSRIHNTAGDDPDRDPSIQIWTFKGFLMMLWRESTGNDKMRVECTVHNCPQVFFSVNPEIYTRYSVTYTVHPTVLEISSMLRFISESLETIFWVRNTLILWCERRSGDLFDPGSGMGKMQIQDPG